MRTRLYSSSIIQNYVRKPVLFKVLLRKLSTCVVRVHWFDLKGLSMVGFTVSVIRNDNVKRINKQALEKERRIIQRQKTVFLTKIPTNIRSFSRFSSFDRIAKSTIAHARIGTQLPVLC